MLAAGALPVVLPCNDKAAACRLCSCGEFRVAGGQAVICQIRHIGTEGKKLRVGGHDVVCCDIVLYLNQRAALDFLGYLCILGEGLNIGASDNLHTFAFGCRRNDEVIVYHEMLRHGNQRGFSQCMGICHNACQCGCNGCFGADDINLCGFCPASAFKVSVDGTQGNRIRCRSLSHADAGAAATFQNTRACGNNICQCAVCRQHIHHLLGAGRDNQTDIGMNGFSF